MEARGKNAVDLRFLSLLSVYNIQCPNDTNLNYIYTSILAGHLSIFSEKIQAITNVLIEIIIELYEVHIFTIQFHTLLFIIYYSNNFTNLKIDG